MDISPFIQTTFGAVVGGAVVLITNRVMVRAEKRKEIQDWYEKTYITEGVDRLLAYLTHLSLCFLPVTEGVNLSEPDVQIPSEALTRIEILLGKEKNSVGGVEYLGVYIASIHKSVRTDENADSAINMLFQLIEILFELRWYVLSLIPSKVNRKNQQLDVSDFRERFESILREYYVEVDKPRKLMPSRIVCKDLQ